jgi:hypothetical protein
MESNYSKIEEIRDLKNLKLIRDEAHTKIYKGIYKGKNAYIKILKNYSSRVKKHDVLKSKNELNKLGIKSFEIMAAGKIKDEKFYISEEVIGKDFEMLLNEGKTFEELKSDISITMAFFVKMLKNNLFYFGYNLKNVMLSDREFILIDIEEIEKKPFFKKKAKMKSVWTVLKSLKLGAQRTNISYKILEKMIYEEYNKEFDDLLDLKKQIAFYQKVRDIKKDLKRKRKVRK